MLDRGRPACPHQTRKRLHPFGARMLFQLSGKQAHAERTHICFSSKSRPVTRALFFSAYFLLPLKLRRHTVLRLGSLLKPGAPCPWPTTPSSCDCPLLTPPDAHAFVRTPEVHRGDGAAESKEPARNLCPSLVIISADKAAPLHLCVG